MYDKNKESAEPKYLNDVWESIDGIEWFRVINNADFSPRKGHAVVSYDNCIYL